MNEPIPLIHPEPTSKRRGAWNKVHRLSEIDRQRVRQTILVLLVWQVHRAVLKTDDRDQGLAVGLASGWRVVHATGPHFQREFHSALGVVDTNRLKLRI